MGYVAVPQVAVNVVGQGGGGKEEEQAKENGRAPQPAWGDPPFFSP